jgi:hypothetical protein
VGKRNPHEVKRDISEQLIFHRQTPCTVDKLLFRMILNNLSTGMHWEKTAFFQGGLNGGI